MIKISRRAWLGMAGAATAAGLVGLPPLQRETRAASLTPRELLRERNFPNVELATHEGEKVRFYDDLIKDKFVTINMVYTSCKTTCPLTTANLVRVQKTPWRPRRGAICSCTRSRSIRARHAQGAERYARTFGVGKGGRS